MGSFSAKYDLNKLKTLAAKTLQLKEIPIDKGTAEKVGEAVVVAVKAEIAKGNSPIEGNGKFPAYKKPKNYPGNRKPHTPVNLYLSGDFQDSLTYSVYLTKSGFGTILGYSGNQEVKEEGHRKGKNGQPKRPSLPSKSGEDFIAKIRKVFFNFYQERINSIFK